MIEMVSRSGPPEALLCPAFICDTCRQQVVNSGNVVYALRLEPRRESSPLFVAHKGVCDRALESRLAERYPLDEGWTELWEELGVFVKQLAHNSTNPFTDDTEGTYRANTVVHPRPTSR